MLERQLAAFRPEWERLGQPASRLGFRNGQSLVKHAQDLRDAGLLESRLNGPCLEWRLVEVGHVQAGRAARVPETEMVGGGRYEPPEEFEGPHAGLAMTVAKRLREKHSKPGSPDWLDTTPEVRLFWLGIAHDTLELLFDIGSVGPAGHPDPGRFEGRNYAWLDLGNCWEIYDSEGGYVALVNESTDLEIILAAPQMRLAIKGLLDQLPPNHPLHSNPQIAALDASLPENRSKKKENDDGTSS